MSSAPHPVALTSDSTSPRERGEAEPRETSEIHRPAVDFPIVVAYGLQAAAPGLFGRGRDLAGMGVDGRPALGGFRQRAFGGLGAALFGGFCGQALTRWLRTAYMGLVGV